MTKTAMTITMRARSTITGWASSKAGCTWARIIQMTSMITVNQAIWRRMSGAAKSRRSAKNAAGTSRATKNTRPRMMSSWVPRTSG